MGLYKMSGICKGIVIDTNDPAGFNRIRVRIPELHGPVDPTIFNNMDQASIGGTISQTYWIPDDDIPWAEVNYPFGSTTLPEVNQVVTVGFFSGETSHPVVLGWLGYEYTDSEQPFLRKWG